MIFRTFESILIWDQINDLGIFHQFNVIIYYIFQIR